MSCLAWACCIAVVMNGAPPAKGPAALPEAKAGPQAKAGPEAKAGLVEILPGVRVNRAERLVEFDGKVAVDCHDPQTPTVYLEVIVTAPDTREHEALVVTSVKPSLIHAGLLAVGSEPGRPGWFERGPDGRADAKPPTGSTVKVELVTRDAAGVERVATPAEWMVHVRDGTRPAGDLAAWVHAGSRMVWRKDVRTGERTEVFDADGAGVIVGLHTFGSEVIALTRVLNPEAGVDEPVWIADSKAVPRLGEKVTVRLRVAKVGGVVEAVPAAAK